MVLEKWPGWMRPSWIEVDLDAIENNARRIKSHIKERRLLAVVKADAYGTGAVKVCPALLAGGVDLLGVVMIEEAIELRRAGIKAPILNMGAITADSAEWVLKYDLEQMVCRPEVIRALSAAAQKAGRPVRLHYKVDTGMSRYGAPWQSAADRYLEVAVLPGIHFVGVMSHFAMSDALDKSYTLLQLDRFQKVRREFQRRRISGLLWHIANSGATLDVPEAHLDGVRVGLMMYGFYPSAEVRRPFRLNPAVSLKSRIIGEREIGRGTSVGYGRRFIAQRRERLGILPIGYADGYSRSLRGRAVILIKGRRLPLIGGLCMDACFIKLTDAPEVRTGDVATLMGRDGDDEISPHEIGEWMDSVSYEVLSGFGARLPRVYLRGGKLVEICTSAEKNGSCK